MHAGGRDVRRQQRCTPVAEMHAGSRDVGGESAPEVALEQGVGRRLALSLARLPEALGPLRQQRPLLFRRLPRCDQLRLHTCRTTTEHS